MTRTASAEPKPGAFVALHLGETSAQVATSIMKLPTSLSFIAPLAIAFLLGACQEKTAAPVETTSDAPVAKDYPNDPVVAIKTNFGVIRAELFAEKAPKTVENFLKYVESKHFDNTIFHRVISDFMIQGGGFENQNGNFVEKATLPPVVNEAHNGIKNRRGTLAMARTTDPHSATSQFFINVGENEQLNLGATKDGNGYAVFGKVLSGLNIVDQIRNVPTETGRLTSRTPDGGLKPDSHKDVPVKAVIIESITLEK